MPFVNITRSLPYLPNQVRAGSQPGTVDCIFTQWIRDTHCAYGVPINTLLQKVFQSKIKPDTVAADIFHHKGWSNRVLQVKNNNYAVVIMIFLLN